MTPTPTRTRKAPAAPAVLRSRLLAGQRWLVHGFSTRQHPAGSARRRRSGGPGFNLGLIAGAEREEVERNRQDFIRAVAGNGTRTWRLVQAKQVHSDMIHRVSAAPEALLVGDGLVTCAPGLLLAVKVADCVPVLLADPKRRAVGAFHAGWRGTAARVVEKGVGAMRREFGSLPEDLLAVIGPCIRSCCYAVGEEVRERFHAQFSYAAELFVEHFDVDPVREKYPNLFLTARAPGHAEVSRQIHLDLAQANRRQLLAAGLRASRIDDLGLCTACRSDLLFSHRADQGKTGRMMAVVGVKP